MLPSFPPATAFLGMLRDFVLACLGVPNGGHNIGVSSAPADIAAHLFADVSVGANAPLVEEPHRRADLAGRAVAALEGVAREECFLHGVQAVAVGQAFDRRDLGATVHDGERKAGIDPPTVDQNRAGTALAVVTAFLRAAEA